MAQLNFKQSNRQHCYMAVFTLALSEPLAENVLLTYNTIDGSAIAGLDYIQAYHEWLEIPAGVESCEIKIEIVNPFFFEQNKNFYIEIVKAELLNSNKEVNVVDPISIFTSLS